MSAAIDQLRRRASWEVGDRCVVPGKGSGRITEVRRACPGIVEEAWASVMLDSGEEIDYVLLTDLLDEDATQAAIVTATIAELEVEVDATPSRPSEVRPVALPSGDQKIANVEGKAMPKSKPTSSRKVNGAAREPWEDPPADRFDDGDRDELPTIPSGTDISRQVDQAVEALRADGEIYVRGGALTRVIASDGTEAGPVRRDEGAPVMRRVESSYLRERLSLHARFTTEKTQGRGQNREIVEVEIQPPGWIATHVVTRGTWPRYRSLVGIVTSPTMRRDGSVVQVPGYDAASGLLYIPSAIYRAVPDAPKVADAIAARDRLLDVIVDFPLDDLGRAGWIALLFTLAARELIEGSVPMVAVDAHTAASGKGLLARTAHVLTFASDIPHMSLPSNDEEMRKQITTTLLAGDRAVLLDNVTLPIGGDSLEALITAPVWKTRLLGKLEDSGELAPRTVMIASGNGIQLVGDMGRRTLRIKLDSPHEKPEERTDYKHEDRGSEDLLLAWVRAHRADLIVDALTCLRAWHVHGRKGEAKPWGSFNGWVSTIACAVQWLGLPDPSEARATSDAMLDPALQALSIIYDAIDRLTKDRDPREAKGVTAGDLVRAAFPMHAGPSDEDELAEAIDLLVPSRWDASTKAKILGRKLKVGRIIQGRKLVAVPQAARAVRYHLE